MLNALSTIDVIYVKFAYDFKREKVHNEDEIEKLEKKLIGDKEWILRGEISSKARPANSLVEQDIDFRKNIKVS